ncbi:CHASE2 domain-containing protein [Thiocapsa sp.]|uniref:adenylate/guanylate cyclase domain-containing protein n=1 Tax=Thiocapsa sp. TaxID=2024551 RepID=UPI0025DD4388|nr:CHASE2 domain-containing protein [Thiocapsa sp.]
MPIQPRLKQLPAVAALLMLALLVWIQIQYPPAFAAARQLVFDAYIAASPASPDAPISVVSIDETSLARHGPWPWPESRLAALIDELRALGAAMVGLALIPTTEHVRSEIDTALPDLGAMAGCAGSRCWFRWVKRSIHRSSPSFCGSHSGIRASGIAFGETRIGVHSGEVIVGNFGGSRHLDYRAFGDPINTAARLETANKVFGTRLILSAATLEQCPSPPATRPIGELLLKGKTRPVSSFTPLTDLDSESGLAEAYARAYGAMAHADDTALTLLEACSARFPADTLTQFHLQRFRTGSTGVIFAL